MPFQQFIKQANHWGEKRKPFFFLIDFEQQKPIIQLLEQIDEQQLRFHILGRKNFNKHSNIANKTKLQLNAYPASFSSYLQSFNLVQQALQKGNSYLLNLTCQTKIDTNYNLEQIFILSNAPFKLYLKDQFVCFSPEPFVQIRDNQIATYPMKGTINAELDNAEQQLLNNQKEEREHYTIVDLMRNDLALIATNIQVKRFRYIEKIQTEQGAILQTSSEITGDIMQNWQNNIGDILAKLLPAGSISGAPKRKTVEIIQNAEQSKRGYYSGIFGIFDGNSLQSAVAIRFIEKYNNQYFFRSGGGITIESKVADEYQELIDKIYIPLQ